jgi:peptidoglycan/xylan/chitin deacetylase (PgdA/CDA1 family)
MDEEYNPYFGIPKVMEIEEKYSIRSTFFFRPRYGDGSEVGQYKKTLHDLMSGGWEVGLHANNTSAQDNVNKEKGVLEKVTGKAVNGCRVHCLKLYENTFSNFAKSGIKYDSSISFNKEKIDPKNTGYLTKSGVTVFPITFMDAYLFTYMGLTEETIVPFIVRTTEELFASGTQIITLLWHDTSVNMKGGRIYPQLIEQLVTKADITFLTGIQAFEEVQKQICELT